MPCWHGQATPIRDCGSTISSGPGARSCTTHCAVPHCGPSCANRVRPTSPCCSTTYPNTSGGWARARSPHRWSWVPTPHIAVRHWLRSSPTPGASCWSPTRDIWLSSKAWTSARVSGSPRRPTHVSSWWTPTRNPKGRRRAQDRASETSAQKPLAISSSHLGQRGSQRHVGAPRAACCSSVPCSPNGMDWGRRCAVTSPCRCSTRTR